MTPEDEAILNAHIAAAGFTGPSAKRDWIASQIPAMRTAVAQRPKPRPRDESEFQRRPMSGGDAILAALGNAGVTLRAAQNDLHRLAEWTVRIDPVFIRKEHERRVRDWIPLYAEKNINAIDAALGQLNTAIDRVLAIAEGGRR